MNNEEDRQGLIELVSAFLDKLTGGETRAVDLNTRFDIEDFFENILEKILGYIFGNLLDNPQMSRKIEFDAFLEKILKFIFGNLLDNSQMTRKLEIETILELIPESILEIIAGLIETPCLLVNLFAADNELLGDACEFFQNIE